MLGRLRLRLLYFVGRLRPLLGSRTSDYAQVVMAGFDQVRPGQRRLVCSAADVHVTPSLCMVPDWVANLNEKR